MMSEADFLATCKCGHYGGEHYEMPDGKPRWCRAYSGNPFNDFRFCKCVQFSKRSVESTRKGDDPEIKA